MENLLQRTGNVNKGNLELKYAMKISELLEEKGIY